MERSDDVVPERSDVAVVDDTLRKKHYWKKKAYYLVPSTSSMHNCGGCVFDGLHCPKDETSERSTSVAHKCTDPQYNDGDSAWIPATKKGLADYVYKRLTGESE